MSIERYEIVIRPVRSNNLNRGLYEAYLGERLICKSSYQPLLDAARVLLAEGVDPKAPIAMRHDGTTHMALSSTVGGAAKLTVEVDHGGIPRFGRFRKGQETAGGPP